MTAFSLFDFVSSELNFIFSGTIYPSMVSILPGVVAVKVGGCGDVSRLVRFSCPGDVRWRHTSLRHCVASVGYICDAELCVL